MMYQKYIIIDWKIVIFMLLIGQMINLDAQDKQWSKVSSLPSNGVQYEDIFFINKKMGWLVNGEGEVYKTTNEGRTWDIQFKQPGAFFSCIGFVDAWQGWIGNSGNNQKLSTKKSSQPTLFETRDGGKSWLPVKSISGSKPDGISSLQVIDKKHIYAIGRLGGSSHFVQSNDGGKNWFAQDMAEQVHGLSQLYFSHPDTGYVVGGSKAIKSPYHSKGVILYTNDAGLTWEERFTSDQKGEYCADICFPNSKTGYVAIQNHGDLPLYNFAKTTDGGLSWEEMPFSAFPFMSTTIFFEDENVGWLAGNATSPYVNHTTDGGLSWETISINEDALKRFKQVDKKLYALGSKLHKYNTEGEPKLFETRDNYLFQQEPKGTFYQETSLSYILPDTEYVQLCIYDLAGRKTAVLVDQIQAKGNYTIDFKLHKPMDEIFIAMLYIGGEEYGIKLVSLAKE